MDNETLKNELLALEAMPEPTKEKPTYPTGWEPGVIWTGKEGTLTTSPTFDAPTTDWSEILKERGLDPDLYEVDGDSIAWCSYDGWKRDAPGESAYSALCYSYKAKIRLKKPVDGNPDDLDLLRLYRETAKARKEPKKTVGDEPATLVVNLSDWQIGNALSDDTPVLTPSGWTKHGEIRPGDFVYGPDGLPKRVLATTGSSVQDCFEVRFDRDVTIIASGDHLWQGYRRYKNDAGLYSRRELTWSTNQIAALKPTVRDGRVYNDRAFHVQVPAPLETRTATLLVDPYVLGAWLGDGKSDSGWIVTADTDLQHWLSIDGTYALPTKPHPTCTNVRFEGLSRDLRLLGVLSAKHVPAEYLGASIEQRLALLQGLMDTDGTIDAKGQAWFDNTNESLAEATYWLVTSLGMKATRSCKQGRLNGVDKRLVYRVQFRPTMPVFRMTRKLERIRPDTDDQSQYRFVQSVTPVGQRSAQCLTVEGSLYLAGTDLVVTHNCDGGGVTTQLEALAALPDLITDQFKLLRKQGHALNKTVIAGLGDLGEGTCGFYPSQPFLTELDRRQQTRVVRRGITEIVRAVAGISPEVIVTAVGGNHGENRQNMKRLTGYGDNDDVAVFEQVAEIFKEGNYPHVAFALPNDRMAIALNLHGQIVAWTHGHLAKPQKNAAQAIWDWWKENTMGRYYPAVADANILISGHFHHLNIKQQENRTVLVCPSLTAVGDWYSNERGVQTVPGTLTFTVTQKGWNNLKVLQ